MNFKNHKQLVLTIMAVALGACSQDPKTPAGGGGGGSGNGANAVEAPSKVVFCRNGDDALTLQFYKSNKSAVLLQDDEITSKGVEYNFNGTVLSYSSTSTLEYMGDSVSGDIYTEEVDGKSVEVFVSETESSKRTHADLVVEDSSGVKVFQPFSCQSKSDIQGYYNNEFHDDLQNYTQREVLDFDSDEDGKISVEEATQILLV